MRKESSSQLQSARHLSCCATFQSTNPQSIHSQLDRWSIGFLLVRIFPLTPDASVGILLLAAIPGTPIALLSLPA